MGRVIKFTEYIIITKFPTRIFWPHFQKQDGHLDIFQLSPRSFRTHSEQKAL